MRKKVKLILFIIIILIIFFLVIELRNFWFTRNYSLAKELRDNNTIKTIINNQITPETNEVQEKFREDIQKNDISNIVLRDEKYTEVHKAPNGETYTIIGSLSIPKINIKYDILSSTSVALLKISLNRYWGAQPNQIGNMCVVGHNYLDKRFFGRLHILKKGDYIDITDSYGITLRYYIYNKFIADPYDTKCTSQLTNGETEITLITCYNKGTQRLVVKARAEKQNASVINEIKDILD